MNKKKILFFAISVLLCFVLSGCGMTSLTADEEEQIALYSAKMIAKYNVNQTQGISYVSDKTAKQYKKDQSKKEKTQQDDVASTSKTDSSDLSSQDASDSSKNSSGNSDAKTSTDNTATKDSLKEISLTDVLGIKGISFAITGTEVVDEFKDATSFVLSPTDGYKFFVVHFAVTNQTTQDIGVDLLSVKPSIYCTVNGSTVSSDSTILLDDLSTFQGTIKANEIQNMVLLFQFPQDSLGDTSGYYLKTKVNGN